MRMQGFLDRVEDGEQAVILIDDIQKALVIPIVELPKGSKEGTYFNIEEKSGQFRVLSIDKRATEREEKKSAMMMEKLRAKQKESKFKRK